MTDISLPLLPIELILRVVESLAPIREVALPPQDPRATSIRSCLLVCRATYPIALRLLYTHCLYIDKSDRLRHLLLALEHHRPEEASFNPTYDYDTGDTTPPSPVPLRTLPPVDVQSCLQNLYLAPFHPYTIDDLPTAQWICELFSLARHTLRRLVLNIPFDTLPVHRDHLGVRRWLDRALRELTAVEEFVCPCRGIHRSQFINTEPVWSAWSDLRRLALHHDTTQSGQLHLDLEGSPRLDSLVLFPEVLRSPEHVVVDLQSILGRRDRDVDVMYLDAWVRGPNDGRRDDVGADGTTSSNHDRESIEAATRKVSSCLSRVRLWKLDECSDGTAKIRFRVAMIDVASFGTRCTDFHRMYPYWPLQVWMRDEAVNGRLWDVEGSGQYKQSQLDPALWFNKDFDDTDWTPEVFACASAPT